METRLGLPLESSGGEATGLRLLRLHRLPAGPALKREKTIYKQNCAHSIAWHQCFFFLCSKTEPSNSKCFNCKPCTSTKYLGSAWHVKLATFFLVKLGKVTALILLAICQKMPGCHGKAAATCSTAKCSSCFIISARSGRFHRASEDGKRGWGFNCR